MIGRKHMFFEWKMDTFYLCSCLIGRQTSQVLAVEIVWYSVALVLQNGEMKFELLNMACQV